MQSSPQSSAPWNVFLLSASLAHAWTRACRGGAPMMPSQRSGRGFELALQGGQHLLDVFLHLYAQQLTQQAADERDVEFKIHRDGGPGPARLRRERPRSLVSLEISLA